MHPIDLARQPERDSWKFVEELKQEERPAFVSQRETATEDEVSLAKGIRIVPSFPALPGRLDTAYADLLAFAQAAGIPEGGDFAIVAEKGAAGDFDSFRIVTTRQNCRIIAGDQEGIRRGIYYLEDLILAAGGPFLKIGEICRKAWMKDRISRCFFGPIKRPPLNRDELMDDYDYYPDAYLNRLAREGVNGLWLTVAFKDLCKTSITPDYGKDAGKRLAKLRQTAQQCLRYGIKTYIFCIEPISWAYNDPILKKYPELGGVEITSTTTCFCPSSATAARYLYEATNYIFSAVPELGGIINISLGECITTCLSSYQLKDDNPPPVACPRCAKIEPRDIIYNSLDAMAKGMRAAAPSAVIFSWLYVAAGRILNANFAKLSGRLPDGVTLLYNFESGVVANQLGKERIGGDYWLSQVGPSENFRRLAAGRQEGSALAAKLQVSCSHEVATAPYVPVPSLLYRKYREMRKLGVSGAMQCWYFGNYPGLMNKAAGMLAFEDFTEGEETFLEKLAYPYWGKHAAIVRKAWSLATDGYVNYPLSNMIQYYGPFHAGCTWPLYPSKKYKPLAPSWIINYPVSGDCIGECLASHNLAEACELSAMLCRPWDRAAEIMNSLRPAFAGNPERLKDIGIMEALGIQFRSARNIFRFYQLRDDSGVVSPEMAAILAEEIRNSRRLAELCEADSRLGFHSEAEGYLYFPAKLRARADFLETVADEPPDRHVDYSAASGFTVQARTFSWSAKREGAGLRVSAECHGTGRPDNLFFAFIRDIASMPLKMAVNSFSEFFIDAANRNKVEHKFEALAGDGSWRISLLIPLALVGEPEKDSTIRIALIRNLKSVFDCSPEIKGNFPLRFRMQGIHNPEYMFRIKL